MGKFPETFSIYVFILWLKGNY